MILERNWDKHWNRLLKKNVFPEIDFPQQKMISNILVAKLKRYIPKGKILEAGAGSGILSIKLSKEGYSPTVLDSSRYAIKYCRKIAKKVSSKIKFRRGNLFSIPFKEDTFECCFNFGVLEHYIGRNLRKAINEMFRVVKRGGIVIIGIPNLFSPENITKSFLIGKKEASNLKLILKLIKDHSNKIKVVYGGYGIVPSIFPIKILKRLNLLNSISFLNATRIIIAKKI